MSKRPTEKQARKAIEAWLDEYAPGYPTYGLCKDGEGSWAFWIVDQDTTSYLKHDLSIEWYGTGWPDDYRYDPDTGNWIEADSPQEASDA